VSDKLIELHDSSKKTEFVKLLIGESNPAGNYSASEHGHDANIWYNNRPQLIWDFGTELLYDASDEFSIISAIENHAISYLKLAIGTEMACMLRPKDFYVANSRTCWGFLVVKHNGDRALATEEWNAYQGSLEDLRWNKFTDEEYCMVKDLYVSEMRPRIDVLYEESLKWTNGDLSLISQYKYLWVDSICSHFYATE
jgi:hypothetical protein